MNKLKLITAGLFIACLGIGKMSAQAADQTPPKKVTTPGSAAKASSGKAASASTAKPAQHMKKDGTPDMRYKENKAAGKTGTKKAVAAPAK